MNKDIMADRVLPQPRCYPPADPAKQKISSKCLSQSIWPIQCPCVLNGVAHNFIPRPGLALVFALAKLLRNWHDECFLFLDIKDARLGLRVYVKHTQVKTDLKFSHSFGDQIRTDPSKTPSPDAAQTLILTIPLSYSNHILTFMLSKKVMSRIPPEKTKAVTSTEVTHQDAWGQVFHDKFHKEKGLGTRGISLCQDIRKTNSICIVGFVSSTP